MNTQADVASADRPGVPSGEEVFVYARRCPGFPEHDLHQSTTRLPAARNGLCAHAGDIEIGMRAGTAEETDLPGPAGNGAGIEMSQIIRDPSGRAFRLGHPFWRGWAARVSARAIVGGGWND